MIRRISYFAFIAVVALLAARLAMAQDNTAPIDSQYSYARLFLAASKSPDIAVNAGVARVSGRVNWNDTDPSASAFDFTAYPAGQNQASEDPGNPASYKNLPETGSYTVIDFTSKHVESIGEGTYRVTGDLTVTQTERQASYGPSESYSGPVYGPAVVHSAKQVAVFVFRRAQTTQNDPAKWLATGIVTVGELPELLTAVAATDWPIFVAEEHCVAPSNVGEDFSGPACSDLTVDRTPRTDVQCAMPSNVGEDFAGEQCTGTPLQLAANTSSESQFVNRGHSAVPAGQLVADEVRLQLELQLEQPSAVRLATSGQ